MIIRSALETELYKILDIQKEAFKMYVGDIFFQEKIPPLNETIEEVKKDFKTKCILVAEADGKITGSVRYIIKGGVCILDRLSVLPEFHRSGIGRKLVAEVEKQSLNKAHKIYLETGLLADNLIKFYTKLGFSGEAILKNHYGEFDWIAFSKFIKK